MVSLRVYFLVLSTVGLGNAYLECPPFWTSYGGNCYRFFGQGKTWEDAEAHCNEFFTRYGQGHLASIHSSDENNFVREYMTTSIFFRDEGYDRVWFGMADVEGTFKWSDGSPGNYTQWGQGQPDGDSNCSEFVIGPTPPSWIVVPGWDDVSCTREYSYICKVPTALP